MRFAIMLALVCTLFPAAYAVETSDTGSITLDQVIVKVLERSPQLGINNYEAQAAAAKIRQAQQTSPLEFKLELENFAGSGNFKSADRLESTLSLAKILEPESKVTSRSDIARQQASLLRNSHDSHRLDLLAKAAEQFIHVVVDQHRLEIAENHLALVKNTFEVVSQRVSAGRSHVAEQRRLAIAVARAEIELEHAEHELSTSRIKLATNWGETQPGFSHAQARLFELPPVAAFRQLEALLTNNPDLVRFATEERLARARLRLAQTRRTPSLQLSGGIRYFNDPSDAALVLSASLPFGSQSRARPEIEEMQHLSQREPLRHEQQRLALYSNLYELYQELLHARTAFDALNRRIIPEAEQASDDYEQGYRRGRFSLLELNEAQRTLLDARLEAVMTAAKYHRLKIELERLTGAALQAGEPQ